MSMQVIAPYGENELFPIPRKCFNKIAVRRITLSEVMLEIPKVLNIYKFGPARGGTLIVIPKGDYSFYTFKRIIENGHIGDPAGSIVSVEISGGKVYFDVKQPIILDKELADLLGLENVLLTKTTPIKWGFPLIDIYCELVESYRDGKPSHFLCAIRPKVDDATIYEPASTFFLEIYDSMKISNFRIWSEPKISGLEVTLEFSP